MDREVNDQTLKVVAQQLLRDIDGSLNIRANSARARHSTVYSILTDEASGFDADEILNYLKKKGFLRMQRSYFLFHPIVIRDSPQDLLFSTNKVWSGDYFVCQICDRGYTTEQGLGDHLLRSPKHVACMQEEIKGIACHESEYHCPFTDCAYSASSKKEVVRHLKGAKTKRFNSQSGMLECIDSPTLWHCDVCTITMPSNMKFPHLGGSKHRSRVSTSYYSNRDSLMEDKNDIEIWVDGVKDSEAVITMGNNSSKNIKFQVKNNSADSSVTLLSCELRYDVPCVIISDEDDVTGGDNARALSAGDAYEIEMDVKPSYSGITVVPLVFTFTRPLLHPATFQIMKERSIQTAYNPELYKLLQPSRPYAKPKQDRSHIGLKIIDSEFKPAFANNSDLLMPLRPDEYRIPSIIMTLVHKPGLEESVLRELNLNDLDFSNYGEYFNNLLYLEEHQMQIDIKHYTMKNVTMRKDSRNGLLRLEVPGLAENRPSVLRGDRLYAIPLPARDKKYQGHVHDLMLTELALGFTKSMRDSFIANMTFDIEFTINRLGLRVSHRAVSWAGENCYDLENVLFPDTLHTRPSLKPIDTSLKLFASAMESNAEQKMAVKHIVCGTSRPAPYLIYGPPGTGKTFTLVEAIKQVYKECPSSRILACAPQNAAVDLVTERLLGHVDKRHILRVHAMSRSYNDVSEKIREVSNYRDRVIWFPSKEELKEKRVILVTLVTSGRLVSAEMTDHFTHIFIDEAGHATEPETVIPLANLLNVNMSSGGQVVLAGDPKQLGPVIRSSIASAGGLGISLLERLMANDVYARSKVTKRFDPNYVTKLVQSFRSHADILKVPNECFYDSELQVCADLYQRERFCSWEGLPKKGFPLIFHGVNGTEQREASSPSWFNVSEVDVIQQYVKQLMDSKARVTYHDIGIISPYHQQVKKIKRALEALELGDTSRTHHYNKINVGSVEKFQGGERDVIIISTVRSQDIYLVEDSKFNLGFVRNPKRFNVAVTRAKSLLIVVGNPAILAKDENWKKLIVHIRDGGGYSGCALPANFGSNDADEDSVDDLEEWVEAISLSDEEWEAESAFLQLVDDEWKRTDG